MMSAPFMVECDNGLPKIPVMDIVGIYDVNHYALHIDSKREKYWTS